MRPIPSQRRSLLAAVAAVAAVTLAAAPALAFNIIGSNANPTAGALLPPTTRPAQGIFRHWDLREFDDCTIPYALDAHGTGDISGGGDLTAIVNAANSWNAVAPAVVTLFHETTTLVAPLDGMDDVNIILFDNTNITGHFPTTPSAIIGITSIFTEVATGRILEADIVFNDRDYQWNNTADNLVDVQSGTQNFNVSNGQTLTISVDGGPSQTVTFSGIATNGAATALEIGQDIINQVGGINVFVPGGNRVKITSQMHHGTGTINVTGGTAAAALGFTGGTVLTDAVDVETIALHELGHFLGIHHSSNDPNEPNATYKNAVMYWSAPNTGTKRVLTHDDTNALNFLYTPDLGDAPDQQVPFNSYQSLVHSTVDSRMLTFVQLHQPGMGPYHLYDYFAEDTLRLEWLGPTTDGNVVECEARVTDLDASDDGITLPSPMYRGRPNLVRAVIRYRDATRYDGSDPFRRLYFNGYFDWPDNKRFDPSDLEIWWTGTPIGGTFSHSPNWIGAAYTPGQIVLTFEVTPPLFAPATVWTRHRLDLGEDEGRVANISGTLAPAEGASQFGEVEDYPVTLADPTTAVGPGTPAELSLAGMAPNPTDGAGIVTFALPRSGHAHLAMYSLDGRRIRLLADRDYEAGTQHVAWDGTDDHGNRMAAGIYFLKLVYGNETRVSRTVILR